MFEGLDSKMTEKNQALPSRRCSFVYSLIDCIFTILFSCPRDLDLWRAQIQAHCFSHIAHLMSFFKKCFGYREVGREDLLAPEKNLQVTGIIYALRSRCSWVNWKRMSSCHFTVKGQEHELCEVNFQTSLNSICFLVFYISVWYYVLSAVNAKCI